MGWLTTVWFAVLGTAALVASLRSRTWLGRLSYGIHVLMCLAMAVMPWPALDVPAIGSILVFSAAALWYLGLALFRPSGSAGLGAGHHGSALLLGYHAVMMAAMVWMAALGSTMPAGVAHGMAGMDPAHTLSQAVPVGVPGWTAAPTLALAGIFAAASLWFVVALVRLPPGVGTRRPLPPVVEVLVSLGMALGMAGSLLAMAWQVP